MPDRKMRVIFCGSRFWQDAGLIEAQLLGLRQRATVKNVTIIEGGQRGADRISEQVARRLGFDVEEYPADWRPNGVLDRAAGHKRNAQMLRSGADLVIAFKDAFDDTLQAGGTEGMCRIAKAAGVPFVVVAHDRGGR